MNLVRREDDAIMSGDTLIWMQQIIELLSSFVLFEVCCSHAFLLVSAKILSRNIRHQDADGMPKICQQYANITLKSTTAIQTDIYRLQAQK